MNLKKHLKNAARKHTKRIFHGDTVLSLIVAANFALLLWLVLFEVHPKIFAGINYYTYPIKIQIGNDLVEVNSFEMYRISASADGSVPLVAYDMNGKILSTHTQQVTKTPGIAMDIWSDQDSIAQCVAEVDNGKLFYPLSPGEPLSVNDITALSQAPTNSFYVSNTSVIDNYMYPANYQLSKLAEVAPANSRLRGVYFVDCAHLDKPETIANDVLWWGNYLSSEQRDLYAKGLDLANQDKAYNE